MKKKGQGLSLNTIIVAAIVLIVLIVLWAIFTGRMGGFSLGLGTTQSCDSACNAIQERNPPVGCGDGEEGGKNNENYIGQYDTGVDGRPDDCCCTTT